MTPREVDTELAATITEYDRLLTRYRRGETALADTLRNLADCAAYAETIWARTPWPRYFRRHEGAIHARRKCRGMTRAAALIPALSGVADLAVVAGHGRLCRHCL